MSSPFDEFTGSLNQYWTYGIIHKWVPVKSSCGNSSAINLSGRTNRWMSWPVQVACWLYAWRVDSRLVDSGQVDWEPSQTVHKTFLMFWMSLIVELHLFICYLPLLTNDIAKTSYVGYQWTHQLNSSNSELSKQWTEQYELITYGKIITVTHS